MALGGQMHDGVGREGAECLGDRRAVADIGLDEIDSAASGHVLQRLEAAA